MSNYEIPINIEAKLNVDKSTAEACMRLLEIFLNGSLYWLNISENYDGSVKLSLQTGGKRQ